MAGYRSPRDLRCDELAFERLGDGDVNGFQGRFDVRSVKIGEPDAVLQDRIATNFQIPPGVMKPVTGVGVVLAGALKGAAAGGAMKGEYHRKRFPKGEPENRSPQLAEHVDVVSGDRCRMLSCEQIPKVVVSEKNVLGGGGWKALLTERRAVH